MPAWGIGPSVIWVTDWVDQPLGRYYLYYSDHNSSYIRQTHADDIDRSKCMHEPGYLNCVSGSGDDEVPVPYVAASLRTVMDTPGNARRAEVEARAKRGLP